jgi:hypothetical protein
VGKLYQWTNAPVLLVVRRQSTENGEIENKFSLLPVKAVMFCEDSAVFFA